MTDPLGPKDDAATPLNPGERLGLRPAYISTRGELNEAEQANIVKGKRWALARRRDALDDAFLLALHRRMFGEVWRWAGKVRDTERNFGVPPHKIYEELISLLQDARHQVERASYQPDEIAARFHHRLVLTHPFPNGNGRHARLAADLLLRQLGRPPFSWGAGDIVAAGTTRARYVAALRSADGRDIAPLLAFVRSGGGG